MSFYALVNNLVGLQLAAPYSTGAGTLTLMAGQGASFPAAGRITVTTAATYQTRSEASCSYTYSGVSGDTLTGVAAMVGFADRNFQTGDYVDMRLMAEALSDLGTAVTTLQTDFAGLGTAAGQPASAFDAAGAAASALSAAETFATGQGYQTASQVTTYVTALGYQTASQVTTYVAGLGYQTASQVATYVTGLGYQTASQVATYVTGLGLAPLASPSLTGTPTAPTASSADSTTKIATTAYVKSQGYQTSSQVTTYVAGLGLAPLASPTFTGTVNAASLTVSGSSSLDAGNITTDGAGGLATNGTVTAANLDIGGSSSLDNGNITTDGAGNLTAKGLVFNQAYSAPQTLTASGGAVVWSLGAGSVATLTMSGNVTSFTFSGQQAGGTYSLKISSGGVNYSFAWGAAVKWPSGAAPVLTSGNDLVTLICFDGVNLLGVWQGGFA